MQTSNFSFKRLTRLSNNELTLNIHATTQTTSSSTFLYNAKRKIEIYSRAIFSPFTLLTLQLLHGAEDISAFIRIKKSSNSLL